MTSSRQNTLAWLVVSVLFFGSVINYIDRAVLSVVIPQLRRELSLSNQEYGVAINAFLFMYAIFYILSGRAADWLGYRRSFVLMVSFWSVASTLHFFTVGLGTLVLFRGLLGIGEGGFYPTAMRAIGEWFSPENRAKAVGIVLCGTSVGPLLTPPIVAWLTLQFGWRAAFLVTGGISFLIIPIWLLLHRRIRKQYGTSDPAPAHQSGQERDSLETEALSIHEVLMTRKYWLLLLARAITDAVALFYLFWMPGYFQEVRGFNTARVGNQLWIPYFIADIGALSGGWTSSYLVRRGWSLNWGRKVVLTTSAMLGTLGTAAYFASSPLVSLGLIGLAFFGQMSWGVNIHTVITEIPPKQHIAVLYGITGAAGAITGAMTQPLIGRVVDKSGYQLPFIVAGLTYVLAIALLFGSGKIEPLKRATPNLNRVEV